MHSTQPKWELHYADATLQTPANPCFVLQQHSTLLPFSGRALEIACGLGGNARFLARCGLKTDAWDISDNALTILNNYASLHHLPITPLITDLEQMLLPYQQYDVIVVSRYLNRALCQQLVAALKPKGRIFYQTFLAPVQQNAPSNLEFYLQTGELTHLFQDLRCEVYGEGWLASENTLETHAPKQRYAWFVGRKQ
ncbi:SAM-dependent methyltransferase [Thiosulfatimonas sediminis]|uniref:SAM-dependent methyltransferase n=1 Tax=Thiosulfatimonas sediminis TaxID=2675054 RepID=A0A6F8PSA7_9GAMM|nr:class I SAM-dependent methyltransferase [Thiosulfatimonas sediminis]BBP44870.1 SAM-dependent methyltransferase [Thiosulfatimonas sediminis]